MTGILALGIEKMKSLLLDRTWIKNITAQFDACLSSDEELTAHNWEIGYPDQWAVERAYALE